MSMMNTIMKRNMHQLHETLNLMILHFQNMYNKKTNKYLIKMNIQYFF